MSVSRKAKGVNTQNHYIPKKIRVIYLQVDKKIRVDFRFGSVKKDVIVFLCIHFPWLIS